MLLDLTHLRQPETTLARHSEASAFDGREHLFRIVAPVDLRLTVHKDRDRFRLVGTVGTAIELGCSRCLEAYRLRVDAPFDLHYLPQSANSGETEREVADDDLSAAYYSDETIDLGQLIEEQLYLALPMKPLCRDDCQGLCPQCGANLNAERCSCDVRWSDPRLAGLKALIMEPEKDDA
ncbi:MAG: DUF177 domain-containing protein [Vicinamibacterales bacterium]